MHHVDSLSFLLGIAVSLLVIGSYRIDARITAARKLTASLVISSVHLQAANDALNDLLSDDAFDHLPPVFTAGMTRLMEGTKSAADFRAAAAGYHASKPIGPGCAAFLSSLPAVGQAIPEATLWFRRYVAASILSFHYRWPDAAVDTTDFDYLSWLSDPDKQVGLAVMAFWTPECEAETTRILALESAA